MDYYTLSIKEVLEKLKVSSVNGLFDEQVVIKQKEFGLNELENPYKLNPFILFFSQFKSFIIYILIFALIISALFGEYVDAIVIFIILLFNAFLGFIQEYKAEKAIEALKKLASLNSKVIRNSKIISIDAKNLVPGDIVLLEEGNKVPADARLLEINNFQVSEAAMTGESAPVTKSIKTLKGSKTIADQKNMVFSGTLVVRGKAKAVITSTGMNSQIGKIADMLSESRKESTPLQKKLDVLGKKIVWFTIILCAMVFILGIIKVGNFDLLFSGDFKGYFELIKDWFLIAVSLAVAAVPEGLPAVVTIALALGVKKMLKKNALVRRLPSVETLGETTVICTDKTGTLTLNKMSVRRAFVFGKDIALDVKEKLKVKLSSAEELLFRTGVLCNDATLTIKSNEEITTGDPTELALLKSPSIMGINTDSIRHEWIRIDEEPFDSIRKLMSTVDKNKKTGKIIVHSKGAPEMLLQKCSKILINGKISKLTLKQKQKIITKNEEYAHNALRVLGFAYKPYIKGVAIEKDLIFIGLQGMLDPPRKEVAKAITTAKLAGIRVIMLTGDNGLTAKAIALEIGIAGNVMAGEDFSKLSKNEKIKAIDKTSIFSRVEPKHKMEIVSILQEKGEVVSMTGDGVNDAPAVKKADLGIAMGITGTDVTKESSDLILQDDNFTTIINAIEEGRGIYQNIRKFVNYLLSSNLAEVLFIFSAILIGLPLPLTAVMILWLNFITDGLPALALSLDPNPVDIMQRPPKRKSEQIMDKNMTFNVLLVGVLITIFCLIAFNYAYSIYYDILSPKNHLHKVQTIAFTMLVLMELIRLQVIRSDYKVKTFSNKWLVYAILSSIVLQLVVIYTPLNQFFGTYPLGLNDWILMIASSFTVWVTREIIVRIPWISRHFTKN